MAIEVEEYLAQREHFVLLDVRTPAEFEKGHIPGAINMPLFSNEERVIVGTTYKQKSPEEALLTGLDFVGPKMRMLVENAQKYAQGQPILLHCWRGGKRSGSVGWLLDMAGLPTQTLKGGYKAYRQFLQKQIIAVPHRLIMLSGHTGSRKTEILHELKAQGEQIIDLEGLANHKGSVFGALGQDQQPTKEQFENNLWLAFQKLDPEKRTWIEGESKSIGSIYLLEGFWNNIMCKIPELEINVPKAIRVAHLVENYGSYPIEDLKTGFDKIKKRLGGQHHKKALEALEIGDIAEAASISLTYYDKAYDYSRQKYARPNMHILGVPDKEIKAAAERIIEFGNVHFGA